MNEFSLIKKLIRSMILEVIESQEMLDIADLKMGKKCGGSHSTSTCKIGRNAFYVKFSTENVWETEYPTSLQILVEYLAYKIYGLYSGIKTPNARLVKKGKTIGLVTTPTRGENVEGIDLNNKKLGKMMSKGVYVDVFLANWDVLGNVHFKSGEPIRFDFGGALTYRAQGERKTKQDFGGSKAKELKTMLKPARYWETAGDVYQYADLKEASEEFLKVSWQEIDSIIESVKQETLPQIEKIDQKLTDAWKKEVEFIRKTLKKRHDDVMKNVKFVLSQP